MSRRRYNRWLLAVLALAAVGAALSALAPRWMSWAVAARQASSDARAREELAFHVGTLAYIYGYPLVDMAQQMHNETQRVAEHQRVYAPVNRLFSYGALVTPSTQGNLRLPNHDTLYFSGWYDVSREPLILHVPDTDGRYYTIAVTNFWSEVQHIGRRTTGTAERVFALVRPGWRGALPEGVTPVTSETPRGWLLGRMLVSGAEDAPAALALVDQIWTVPLGEYVPGQKPPAVPEKSAAPLDVLRSLEYFETLNSSLREVPARATDAALLALLDQIGVGPSVELDLERLDQPSQRGLERALDAGRELLEAASSRAAGERGWIVPRLVGRYGLDYLARATVVLRGYGNLPEESLYAAALTDDRGELLTGRRRYRIRFARAALPPVDAFWSLSVYDLRSARLVENEIQRYSLGDRTAGLQYGDDGSLTIALQAKRPSEPDLNWLPTPRGSLPYIAVIRMYEPREAALSGKYELPALVRAD